VAYLDGPRPRLFAHRGSSGTHPENTLEAFAAGLEAGADRLELDVHATRDGHIVVFHDDDLDRTTDASGPLRERTLCELQSLDAGYRFEDPDGGHPFRGRGLRIPTLAEVLEAFPGVALNIEVKHDDGATVERFFALLDRHRARERVLAAAYEDSILCRIRQVAPDALTSLSGEEVAAFFAAWMGGGLATYTPPGKAFQVPPDHEGMEIVTAGFVEAAHDLGMEVHVWTINEEAEMERLLGLGIDGLMTDFPARARRVFERLGLRTPLGRAPA
jgi:glycerophosphoryl diester phosphodiesterase